MHGKKGGELFREERRGQGGCSSVKQIGGHLMRMRGNQNIGKILKESGEDLGNKRKRAGKEVKAEKENRKVD